MKPGAVSFSSFPSYGFAITASRSGRMSLPVAPSAYIYSQFRHVSGVPAPEGTRGVAITKLKILDVLIEQLGRIKKQQGDGAPGRELSDNRIDALIKQYESQIKSAQSAHAAMPYINAPVAPMGAVFNLVA